MILKELRQSHNLTIKKLSSHIAIAEKRLKIIERGLDMPTEDEVVLLKNYFVDSRQPIDWFVNEQKLIGEGYVTAVNNEYKVKEPLISKIDNNLKVLDLFCGIGGLSYGFEQTGKFTTVGGLDLLDDRINTFQFNHQHAFGFSFDISTFDPKKVNHILGLKPNVIVGGAPCQGFSSIRPFRSLSEDDGRNNLFKSFAKYLNHFKPEWFVFENVVGLLTHKKGETLKILLKEFETIGYKVDFRILNSAFYGIPQLRERLIIVGNRIKVNFEWPIPSHFYEHKSMAGVNSPYVLKPKSLSECLIATSVMNALSDLPAIESGGSSAKYLDNEIHLTEYQKYLRAGSKDLFNHEATVHSEQMMNIIRNSGYNIEAVKHLVTSGFSSCYSRLEPNKPSVTLTVNFTNPSSNKCIHPIQNRALTPREGARLQGFPDKFKFSGAKTQIVKQIGNAVPPILSKVIADSIIKYY